MATVRISGEMISKVAGNAKDLYKNRLTEIDKAPANTGMECLQAYIADTNSVEAYSKACQLGWLQRGSQLNLNYKGKQNILDLPSNTSIPMCMSYYGSQGLKVEDNLHLPAFKKFADWYDSKEALNEECKAFVEKVEKFLGRHSTLRQALLEWSGLWELLPQEYKYRHNKAENKSSGAKAKEEFNVDDLTLTVVKSKMVESAL